MCGHKVALQLCFPLWYVVFYWYAMELQGKIWGGQMAVAFNQYTVLFIRILKLGGCILLQWKLCLYGRFKGDPYLL